MRKRIPTPQPAACPLPASPAGEAVVQHLTGQKAIPKPVIDALRERAGGRESAFERLVLDEGYLDERSLQKVKAEAHGWETVDLDKVFINESLAALVPRRVAIAQMMLPFAQEHREVHVATVHPDHHIARRLLEKKFGVRVRFFLATGSALQGIFRRSDPKAMRERPAGAGVSDSVVELVDQLLRQSVERGTSDIHIEPGARHAIVRERIDGFLRHTLSFTRDVHEHVTQRIKIMANLATDEHAIPQDGKLVYWTPEKKRVDVRISIVPTFHGEKIVMRLLVAQDELLALDALGFRGRDKALLDEAARKSWGMILITGPTGSGKSTTLYTMLQQMNSEALNLSTIEDPVEYEIRGANQIQVNEKTGLTFAAELRALLRQDPNIMLVGEIRDRETADIGINAAMTGHLVLSTLHTNNAATAIPRLLDMKIQPFLITSVLHLVVAQRLVRKLCQSCREEKLVEAAELASSLPPDLLAQLCGGERAVRLHQARGCGECDNAGYRGRCGIFEVLLVDADLRELVLRGATTAAVEKAAISKGMTTMLEDGIAKAKDGITTIQEILRVTRT